MNPQGRLDSFDRLRGVAVLGVFLFHLSHRVSRQYTSVLWEEFAKSGLYAVQLFFCLSGFLVWTSYQQRLKVGSPRTAWRGFFLMRFFRIVPLWWLTVMLSAFLQGGMTWQVFFLNISFLFGFVGFNPELAPIVVSWSLFAEVVFYLGVPWLARILDGPRKGLLFFGVSLGLGQLWMWSAPLIGVPNSENFLERSPLYNLQFFALGILGSLLRNSQPLEERLRAMPGTDRRTLRYLGWLLLVAFGFQFVMKRDLFSLLVVLGLLLWDAARNLNAFDGLMGRTLGALGRACYSFYLLHLFIFDLLEGARRDFFRAIGLFGKPAELQMFVWGPILFAICFAAAWMSYRVFETPLIRWGSAMANLRPKSSAKVLDKSKRASS